ncbi:hypothetical protein P154DRAFT_465323 [Amniculicola lignicola CBS 123094]|uniref:Uncharacterized protein n=1 Tax=Amniculicola lignicola CBS 123094 TaxID=1392246 RepID=A0A6A5WH57_9PLEO|nr:hypothetical protein P154DRAFT_465323 [Amniculicola lignicola CBS 123094]
MALTFHALAVPPLLRAMKNTIYILTKAETHAAENKIDIQDYLSARLYPDMHPLPYQIYRLTDSARFLVSRSTETPHLSMADDETTIPDLITKLNRTIEYLESVEPSAFDGQEKKEVSLKVSSGKGGTMETTMEALDYVRYFAHPNFWFHTTTAYGILRMKGVPLGKVDFLNGAGLAAVKNVEKPE